MDIEISTPINITLDVVELDEHLPSMKFNIAIRVKKFGYNLGVTSDLWVECECFDAFTDNMRKGNIAVLKDMNGFFELQVNPTQNWVEWSCVKEDLDGHIISAQGREKLTDTSKYVIYEAFNNFPKWW